MLSYLLIYICHEQIVYTKGPDVQVHVHAEVVDPEKGTREATNDFHFTFDTGVPNVPKVMPKTYAGTFDLTNTTSLSLFADIFNWKESS